MEQRQVPEQISDEAKQIAARRARERARSARWDLNIAVFLFAVLIIILILLFQGVGIVVVAPVAIVGLATVWVVGWRRGKKLYLDFYKEELANLAEYLEKRDERLAPTLEETIEEKVQKALRERLR